MLEGLFLHLKVENERFNVILVLLKMFSFLVRDMVLTKEGKFIVQKLCNTIKTNTYTRDSDKKRKEKMFIY